MLLQLLFMLVLARGLLYIFPESRDDPTVKSLGFRGGFEQTLDTPMDAANDLGFDV